MSDGYDLHLDRRTSDRLWSTDLDDFEGCEDDERLDRIIKEELVSSRRSRRRKLKSRDKK